MSGVEWSADSGVAEIVLKRPPLNLLSIQMMRDVTQALHDTRAVEPRVVLLRADGPNFSAGADIQEHTPERIGELLETLLRLVLAMREYPVPTIASVRGACLGGGFELALSADTIVASEAARFGLPEVTLGAMAPVGAALLPARVGASRAAEILYTGRALAAPEAAAWGLVSRVVPDVGLDAAAAETARAMGAMSRPALAAAKKALGDAAARGALARAVQVYLEDLARTHDAQEGIRAFAEKRRPEWNHLSSRSS